MAIPKKDSRWDESAKEDGLSVESPSQLASKGMDFGIFGLCHTGIMRIFE